MVNVLYAANDKYFKLVYLSVLSMLKKTKEELNVYVMTLNCETNKKQFKAINHKQIQFLDEVLKKYNPNSKAILLDMEELYNNILKESKNKNTSYSPYTLLRLLSTKIENLPEKIIYIDTDTMVYNDIKELYDIDITNYEFGAVRDAMGHYFFGKNYCNAGVLLLNLKKIKETKLFDKCLKYVQTKKRIMPDQDAINYCSTSKLIIDRKFNEQRDMSEDTVIKHFCKRLYFLPYMHTVNVKQNEIDLVHKKLKINQFDDIYEEYLQDLEKYKEVLI